MSRKNPIFVNGKLFLGRETEQDDFRHALSELLNPPEGEHSPFIFLLYGDGGMGKTTLAARFRDIARDEVPFAGEFQTLWIDWKEESGHNSALLVGRENIQVDTVFDVIHAHGIRDRRGRSFRHYQEVLTKRNQAEQEAAKAVQNLEEKGSPLPRLGGTLLAKLVRFNQPLIGNSGEALVQELLASGIQTGAEKLAGIRQEAETRIRARLKPDLFQIYLNPEEQLALALAEDLKKLSEDTPQIIFLDAYEIVDQMDPWLRLAIEHAGANVLWVLAGRDDLAHNRSHVENTFTGYEVKFPERLYPINVLQLLREQVREYFNTLYPGKPLKDEAAVKAICQATRGIPLAIQMAAEMWDKGVALQDITGGAGKGTPAGLIVMEMTGRYLQHAVTAADRTALYALALANGDFNLLAAMLGTEKDSGYEISDLLARLRREYASVHPEQPRLYDDPAFYIRQHLMQPEMRWTDGVAGLNRRARDALRGQLDRIEQEIPLLERRCSDEDWVRGCIQLADTLFWLDEAEAWRWLLPRLLEGIGYHPQLGFGLLAAAERWRDSLSHRGKQRLEALRAAGSSRYNLDAEETLLAELDEAQAAGWLEGTGRGERLAILHLRRGRLLSRRGKRAEAKAQYDWAENGLPLKGKRLRKDLAGAMTGLARDYLWQSEGSSVVYAPEAIELMEKVTRWEPEDARGWYYLAVGLYARYQFLGETADIEQAVGCALKAVELTPPGSPDLPMYLNNLGIRLGTRYERGGERQDLEDAIQLGRKAVDLTPPGSPDLPMYLNNLGSGLRRRYERSGERQDLEDAIRAFRQAVDLTPPGSPNLPYYLRTLGTHLRTHSTHDRTGADLEEALAVFRRALELDPQSFVALMSLAALGRKLGKQEDYQVYAAAAHPLLDKQSDYNRACFFAVTGEVEQALELLRNVLESGKQSVEHVKNDPDWEWLRDDPRFLSLLGEG